MHLPDGYNPKQYDVYLGKYGYRVRTFSMDSAPSIAPQFNSGQQGENDLDMLRIDGNDNFLGGMFQEEFDDPTMASTVINGYVNPDNERLYPTPAHSTLPSDFTSDGAMSAHCIYQDMLVIAVRNGDTNEMWQISSSNVITSITLPAALTDATVPISSLFVPTDGTIAGVLIGTGNDENGGVPIHRFYNDTVVPWNIDGDVDTANKISSLRSNLFFIHDGSDIFQYDKDNNLMAKVNTAGPKDPVLNKPTSFLEFNHRIWIGKPTGLYSFDGVTSAVFIESESQLQSNLQHTAILHGWMYFNMDGYVWRHNSITVERLRDFRDTEILGMTAGVDRVFILTSGGPGNSVIDKDGWDVDDTNVWCYDGVGWFLYNNAQTGPAAPDYVAVFDFGVYTHFIGSAVDVPGSIDFIDLSQDWQPGAKEVCTIIGSEMANNYPNIDKYLDSIEVDYEDLVSDDSVVVSYRNRSDTGNWYPWTDGDKPIDLDNPNPKRFFITDYKLIQYKIVITKDEVSNLSVESAVLHYSVMPPSRKRWRVGLVCAGADAYGGEVLKDGSEEGATPKELRNNVYEKEAQTTPTSFLNSDYCILDQSIDDVYLGDITVLGTTNTMRDRGTIFLEGELINYDGKTETTLTLTKRGAWSTTPAAHDTGLMMSEFYRVFVEQIVTENFILNESNENNYRDNPDYGIESTIVCQVTEISREHEN